MITSKEMLDFLEQQMSIDTALDFLDLTADDLGDVDKIKKAYKKAAVKNHPDHGGSDDAMKNVNLAYELLKASKVSFVKHEYDFDKMNKEYQELGKKVKDELVNAFRPEIFTSYFQDIFKKEFKGEITSTFPKESQRNPTNAGFSAEIFTLDKRIVFSIYVSVYLVDVKYGQSLGGGSGGIDYTVDVTAHGLYDRRKQKISRRDYKRISNQVVLLDPKVIFPKAKITKIVKEPKRKSFKRRDMYLSLQKELKAKTVDEWVYIPLNDKGWELVIFRMTFRRVAGWMINGLYLRTGKLGSSSRKYQLKTKSFPEKEELIEFIKELQKKSKNLEDKKLAGMLDKEIQAKEIKHDEGFNMSRAREVLEKIRELKESSYPTYKKGDWKKNPPDTIYFDKEFGVCMAYKDFLYQPGTGGTMNYQTPGGKFKYVKVKSDDDFKKMIDKGEIKESLTEANFKTANMVELAKDIEVKGRKFLKGTVLDILKVDTSPKEVIISVESPGGIKFDLKCKSEKDFEHKLF